jgi:glycosyltransferase involved in cell wall biosynthesis
MTGSEELNPSEQLGSSRGRASGLFDAGLFSKSKEGSVNLTDVGVVIIGRNEGSRLIDCLTSVRSHAQCIVYVDSGSTDGSTQAAGRFGAHVVELKTDQPFTAARARNEGLAALKKLKPDVKLVQFIDGDCELDKDWLTIAANFIRLRGDIAVVCGRRRERNPSESIYNRLCDIEWDTAVGQTTGCGGDSLMRIEPFEAVGGFRGTLIAGEEPELCLRLREKGWKIWRLDAEMTRHDAAIKRWGQWWARTVRFGYAMAEVSQLHWQSPLGIWKKELARAIFWGGLLPISIVVGSVLHPAIIFALLIYPIQVCRIALVHSPTGKLYWSYATLLTLGKFAELQGVTRFFRSRLLRHSDKIIEYK